jgi:hypothetical protein
MVSVLQSGGGGGGGDDDGGVMWSSYRLKHIVQCPFLLPCDDVTESVIWIPWKLATN